MKNNDLVAPCGDYCGGCGQYNGLIVATARQMRELAGLYAFEFRSDGAFDFEQFLRGLEWFIENAKCPGCRQGGGPPACEVRRCCTDKGLAICFECDEFPCPEVENVADPDTMDRYERFKELGCEGWVEEQRQKAAEGHEIHRAASLRG